MSTALTFILFIIVGLALAAVGVFIMYKFYKKL